MTTLPRRPMDWPERLAIIALIAAGVSLLLGGIISAILYLFCALMGWTRVFEQNKAMGKRTMSGSGRVVVAAVLLLLAVGFLPSGGQQADVPVKLADTPLDEAACPAGAQSTAVDFAVASESALRAEPDAKSSAVRKGNGEDQIDMTLERDGTVRQMCRKGDWALVRVLTTPAEYQALSGWVPTSSLRKVDVTAQGRRIYAAADFDWPAGSKDARDALVAAMNRIIEDNPECDALDTESLVANGRGAQTVYSVPCWSAGDLRSFDFTAADTKKARSFAPVEPINKRDAIDACKQGVLREASHPSTVEFPIFDYDFREGDGGSRQVLMSAKAKNGFNLELKYDVQCDFTGTTLDQVLMSEARN